MVDYCKELGEQYAKIQEIGPRVIPESIAQSQFASFAQELPKTPLEFQTQSFSAVPPRYANIIYTKSALQMHDIK